MNKLKVLLLLIAASVIGALYIGYYYNTNQFQGLIVHHGEVGYNLAKYNSIKINPERLAFINNLQVERNRLVNYSEIDHTKFGAPTRYRSVNDTIGYGLILGLLWKITGSYNYIDVQILQLLLYLLMLFFVYQIVFMLFSNATFAYFSCVVHLLFLPLIAQNAQALRDIWAYYGTVILLYGVASVFYQKNYSILKLILCGTFFAVCTFLRPTLFATLVLVLIVVIAYGLYSNQKAIAIRTSLSFLITTLLFFWIPFVTYNKIAYDRWFVSPSGGWLIEGMGTFPNQWGYQLSDQWYADFMKDNYGLEYGTPECEDKGRELYWAAVRENPGFFVKALCKQIPDMVFPGLPWFDAMTVPNIYYTTFCDGWVSKLQRFFQYPSFAVLFNLFLLNIYKYVFMLICYIGMFCMIFDRRWFAFLLLGSIMLSGYHFIFSHIEPRYVIPYFWPSSIFVSYALVRIPEILARRKKNILLNPQTN